MPNSVVFNDLPLYGAALRSHMVKTLRTAVETTVDTAKAEIEHGAKSGRIYTHGPQPLPHQASAPGQAPANWTGELAGSIHIGHISPTEAEAVVDSAHAMPLEFGTRHMAARPFWLPAQEAGAAAAAVHVAEVAARLNRPGRLAPE